MAFIRTSKGFLNQDHILWIRVGVEREVGEDLVKMTDGQLYQLQIYDRPFDPDPKPPLLAATTAEAGFVWGETPETDVGRETPKPT